MFSPCPGWTISEWRIAATSGELSERAYLDWLGRLSLDDPAWIFLTSETDLIEQLQALAPRLTAARSDSMTLPLFGVPFAVKDNIDVQGWPTTAACPAFRYVAERDATAVRRLKEAGALIVGKTNLDQFATGLVGTRSPYGLVRSAFDPQYIAGGSSSGSASVVTHGLLPFTLGTDTAGSGRVPAAFGNIVGWKPTRGLVSAHGVVPACKTLDCVSVFSLTVPDAALVARVLAGFDPGDPYSRVRPDELPLQACAHDKHTAKDKEPCLGVFQTPQFFEDSLARDAFSSSLERLEAAGFTFREVDPAPFWKLAELLYAGAWVAERSLTANGLLSRDDLLDPVVLGILRSARALTAEDAFRSEYLRAELAQEVREALRGLDALIVPTTATTYRVSEVNADPIRTNSRLGIYTNFTNLADLAAVAVPGRFRADGLPTGLTLLGPAFSDERLLRLASVVHPLMDLPLGATGAPLPAFCREGQLWMEQSERVKVVVVGAHLTEMPLNYQLVDRGARLSRSTTTAKSYRLFLLAGQRPEKPGLVRVKESGAAISVEVWELPIEQFGSFVRDIPQPLGMGTVELADGTWEKGFICEPCALEQATDITEFGGFKAFLQRSAG